METGQVCQETFAQNYRILGQVLRDPLGVIHCLAGPFRAGHVQELAPHRIESHQPGEHRRAASYRLVQ
jgi:hypothetical protein